MTDLQHLVWDRCPDCLGLQEPREVEGGVALACRRCGHVAPEVVPLPRYSHSEPFKLDLPAFPGF